MRQQAEFYRLSNEGIYIDVPPNNGIFESTVLEGLKLRVEWLWQEPLPLLSNILQEWKLI